MSLTSTAWILYLLALSVQACNFPSCTGDVGVDTYAEGLRCSQCGVYVGNIDVNTASALQGLQNLTEVNGGDLRLSVDGVSTFSPYLDSLEVVHQDLEVFGCDSLVDLHLPSLTTVNDDIHVFTNPELVSVRMPVLTFTQDDLSILSNPKLATVSAPVLTHIGEARVQNNDVLTVVDFPALQTVSKFITKNNNILGEILLPNLTVGGEMAIEDNPDLLSIYAPLLGTITSFSIKNNDELASLYLNGLVGQGNLFDVNNNPTLPCNESSCLGISAFDPSCDAASPRPYCLSVFTVHASPGVLNNSAAAVTLTGAGFATSGAGNVVALGGAATGGAEIPCIVLPPVTEFALVCRPSASLHPGALNATVHVWATNGRCSAIVATVQPPAITAASGTVPSDTTTVTIHGHGFPVLGALDVSLSGTPFADANVSCVSLHVTAGGEVVCELPPFDRSIGGTVTAVVSGPLVASLPAIVATILPAPVVAPVTATVSWAAAAVTVVGANFGAATTAAAVTVELGGAGAGDASCVPQMVTSSRIVCALEGTLSPAGGPLHVAALTIAGVGAMVAPPTTVALVMENTPPVWPAGNATRTPVAEGSVASFPVLCEDPDAGDSVAGVALLSAPAWLVLLSEESPPTLAGIPSPGDVGTAAVTVSCVDAAGAASVFSFSFEVAAAAGRAERPVLRIASVTPILLALAGEYNVTVAGSVLFPPLTVVLGGTPCKPWPYPEQRSDGSVPAFSFEAPQFTDKGYRELYVQNVFGDAATYDRMFFTDDCPVEGMFGVGVDCQPCPEGGYCPGGNRIWPLEGYWNDGEDSGYVAPCAVPRARCKGGRHSECADGYEGELCGMCSAGFYLQEAACVKCEPTSGRLLVAVNAVFILFLLLACILLPNGPLNITFRCVAMLQVLRGVGELKTHRMPQWTQDIYYYISLVSVDFRFDRQECVVGNLSFPQFYWNTLILVAIFGCTVYCIVLLLALFPPWRTFYKNRSLRTLTILHRVCFLVLATRTVAALTCFPSEVGVRLVADRTVTCFAGEHLTVVIFAVPILLYLVAYPTGLYIFLIRRVDRLEAPLFKDRWGFTYNSVRRDRLSFVPNEFLHLFLLGGIASVFRTMPTIAFLLTLAVTATYIGAALWLYPLKRPRNMVLLIASLAASISLSVNNYVASFSQREVSDEAVAIVAGVSFSIAGIFFLLAFLRILMSCLRQEERKDVYRKSYLDDTSSTMLSDVEKDGSAQEEEDDDDDDVVDGDGTSDAASFHPSDFHGRRRQQRAHTQGTQGTADSLAPPSSVTVDGRVFSFDEKAMEMAVRVAQYRKAMNESADAPPQLSPSSLLPPITPDKSRVSMEDSNRSWSAGKMTANSSFQASKTASGNQSMRTVVSHAESSTPSTSDRQSECSLFDEIDDMFTDLDAAPADAALVADVAAFTAAAAAPPPPVASKGPTGRGRGAAAKAPKKHVPRRGGHAPPLPPMATSPPRRRTIEAQQKTVGLRANTKDMDQLINSLRSSINPGATLEAPAPRRPARVTTAELDSFLQDADEVSWDELDNGGGK